MMARQNNARRWDCTKITSWIAVLSFFLTAVLPLPALAGDAVFYYHNDATGSPVTVTNSAGTKVWGADYEPFGELAGVVENVPNNQQFLAKTVDPETSLHLLGARYYDGKIGRFLSVDPALLKGQPESAIQYPQRLNFYAYSANNPYKHMDPNGQFLETAWDVISFGLSLQAFSTDPSVANAVALAYDTFALSVPAIPAGAGVLLHGAGGIEKGAEFARGISGPVTTLAENAARGRAFETAALKAAGLEQNNKAITGTASIGMQGRAKPDSVQNAITEVKDRVHVTFTRQLQIETSIAKQQLLPLNLIVSPRTESISAATQNAVAVTGGSIRTFNQSTGTLRPWVPGAH